MCYERRRAEACVDESAHHALGPVRNPVLLTQGAPVFPGSSRLGILDFGVKPKTPGARPNHQADRGSDPNHWIWSVCVFYYCRTYYKAVRVGADTPGLCHGCQDSNNMFYS
jgi:hypothetical protein